MRSRPANSANAARSRSECAQRASFQALTEIKRTRASYTEREPKRGGDKGERESEGGFGKATRGPRASCATSTSRPKTKAGRARRSEPRARREKDDDGRHEERDEQTERLAHERDHARRDRVVLRVEDGLGASGGSANDAGRVAGRDEDLRGRLAGRRRGEPRRRSVRARERRALLG